MILAVLILAALSGGHEPGQDQLSLSGANVFAAPYVAASNANDKPRVFSPVHAERVARMTREAKNFYDGCTRLEDS